jgi:glucose/arabinose dehydrogenase
MSLRVLGLIALTATTVAGSALAQTPVAFQPFIEGVQSPMHLAAAQGDTQRVFVLERAGRIKAFDAATGQPILTGTNAGVVLDIRSRVRVQGDGGALSVAFPNDFDTSRVFYVFYNRQPDNANVLARYRLAPGTLSAPATSEEIVLVTPHGNGHNGGWSGFSPINGFLYLSLGDDGTFDNPDLLNKAQTTTGQVFNGKLLRLDVNTPGDDFPADPNRNYRIPATNPFVGTSRDAEIWSYGLRNPWRCGFDIVTGDLWIGDVGQDLWEEVNYQPAASPGGQNYGWRCTEGPVCTPFGGCTCNAPSLTPPFFAYGHDVGCSISPGAVYRGAEFSHLQGLYFYSDFCTPGIWTVEQQQGGFVANVNRTADLLPNFSGNPIAVSNDAAGDVYLLAVSGPIYKLRRLCDTIDFNGNGAFPEDQDVIDFFNVLAGGDCSQGNTCNDIDFNNNNAFPEDQDVIDFFNVLAGGTC